MTDPKDEEVKDEEIGACVDLDSGEFTETETGYSWSGTLDIGDEA